MLTPGEGMLVGSFARAMFLVHSECAESRYSSCSATGSTPHSSQLLRLTKGSLTLQIHKLKAFSSECWPSECYPMTSIRRHQGLHSVLELSQCC